MMLCPEDLKEKDHLLERITVIVLAWHEEVKASYENDSIQQRVITEKMINMNSWPHYQFTEGSLIFKWEDCNWITR